jgi:two-component system KDP operon response regulator KdpE
MSAYRPRILVIDDEPQIHRFLGPALDAAGYEVERADTAADGLKAIAGRAPDAVVLDLGLPDMDGKAALQKARAFYDGPILILSARDREIEKIEALDLGADDYVEKPFSVGELLARLRVALRHRVQKAVGEAKIKAGEVEIDLVLRTVTRGDEPVRLSPKEYELLVRLIEGGGRVITHRQLLTAVWGPAHEHDVQYLRVFVGQLRQKLETDPTAPKIITTEAGVGYRFTSSDAGITL